MRIEKSLRMLYGRFFFRFADGESAADVYDRITGRHYNLTSTHWKFKAKIFLLIEKMETGFRETLRSDIEIGRFQPPGERNPNMNLVIVSHGLTLRVFLMRWYDWTVEQFEGLNNFGNGGILVMEMGYGGRYSFSSSSSSRKSPNFT